MQSADDRRDEGFVYSACGAADDEEVEVKRLHAVTV
jgi:hypothetical protein